MAQLNVDLSDGLVTVRPFELCDRATLIRQRDTEFHRFLGAGSPEPTPTACIWVDERIVGWIDYDVEPDWLGDDEANVGYNVFADDRGNGYATRALRLLLSFLQQQEPALVPTLLIEPTNAPSLAVAEGASFEIVAKVDDQYLLKPRAANS